MTQHRLPFAIDVAAIPDYAPGRDEAQMHADFRFVFYQDTRSLRVLKAILAQAGVFDPLIDPAQPIDPNHVVFGEGQRSIGIWLMQLIDRPELQLVEKRQSEVEGEDKT